MAFSLRKMFSNISYFSKSADHGSPTDYQQEDAPVTRYIPNDPTRSIDFQCIEPDSTSKNPATSLNLTAKNQNITTMKASQSETDLLSIDDDHQNRKCKKTLRIDIKKASHSMSESLYQSDSMYVENTPKHILLDGKSVDMFSETFRKLNFSDSFEFDVTSQSSDDDLILDIESLSECSDTDISIKNDSDKTEIKMCRKVKSKCENRLVPSTTPESFADMEMEKNEEERMSLILNYQMKLDKIECVLKKLLNEFQFHIEVSKIFSGQSLVTAFSTTDVSNIPKTLGQVMYMDNVNRDTPTDSWNIVTKKEDMNVKFKFREQLLSLKTCVESFVSDHFVNEKVKVTKPKLMKRSITFDLHKGQRTHKSIKLSAKKRIKHFDFPDYRDAFLQLFHMENEETDALDTQLLPSLDECPLKCFCTCHNQSLNQSDSGLTTKTDHSNQSITSSIGNFSLDSTTLSVYSESLDQVISYNSFQDASLLSTLLQKPAIERVTFYVQVHSIQLKCEPEDENESKNTISFFCPACENSENEENSLLTHILSQEHCEKIHFLYKTAYIKKCVASGREIQPSTVLNPMRMYRDDNKIVCFGDAMYACSLCFENLIVGESILMAHCSDEIHLERRDKLSEMFE